MATEEDSDRPLNEGHFYELTDRAHVFGCMIDEHLVQYEGLEEEYPEIHAVALRAAGALAEFYQLAGQKMFEMLEEQEGGE